MDQIPVLVKLTHMIHKAFFLTKINFKCIMTWITNAPQDIMTDLHAESELLPLQPVREEWKGHKGMVQVGGVVHGAWCRCIVELWCII